MIWHLLIGFFFLFAYHLIHRRRHSRHLFEVAIEVTAALDAHTNGHPLNGQVAVVGIGKATAGLPNAALVEQGLEILAVVFIDYLRHLFIITVRKLRKTVEIEVRIADFIGVLHYGINALGQQFLGIVGEARALIFRFVLLLPMQRVLHVAVKDAVCAHGPAVAPEEENE